MLRFIYIARAVASRQNDKVGTLIFFLISKLLRHVHSPYRVLTTHLTIVHQSMRFGARNRLLDVLTMYLTSSGTILKTQELSARENFCGFNVSSDNTALGQHTNQLNG